MDENVKSKSLKKLQIVWGGMFFANYLLLTFAFLLYSPDLPAEVEKYRMQFLLGVAVLLPLLRFLKIFFPNGKSVSIEEQKKFDDITRSFLNRIVLIWASMSFLCLLGFVVSFINKEITYYFPFLLIASVVYLKNFPSKDRLDKFLESVSQMSNSQQEVPEVKPQIYPQNQPSLNRIRIIWFGIFSLGFLLWIFLNFHLQNSIYEQTITEESKQLAIKFFTFMAAIALGLSLFIPRMVLKELKENKPADFQSMLQFYIRPFVLSMALTNAIVLFGFMLSIKINSSEYYPGFFSVAAVFYLLHFPTEEKVKKTFS
jgi:hypothetical protein